MWQLAKSKALGLDSTPSSRWRGFDIHVKPNTFGLDSEPSPRWRGFGTHVKSNTFGFDSAPSPRHLDLLVRQV